MDLALAHARARSSSRRTGTRSTPGSCAALAHACRGAKEQLLADAGLAERAGRRARPRPQGHRRHGARRRSRATDVEARAGRRLLPGRRAGRAAASAAARRPAGARPALRRRRRGHAPPRRHFVGAHRRATAVLFNGGVMKSGAPARARRRDARRLVATHPSDDLKVLAGADLDLAVARGAAYYGLVRRGRGVRIRGGTARAYYIGIETAMPAVPGMRAAAQGAVRRALRHGGRHRGSTIAAREFGLVVGEPAEFRFLGSSMRRDDRVGTFVDEPERGQPRRARPRRGDARGRAASDGELVPVHLRATLDEVGTLSSAVSSARRPRAGSSSSTSASADAG